MRLKITTICLIIINASFTCAKNIEQELNDNQSTRIQGLGDNPNKDEIRGYIEKELKKAGLKDKEIQDLNSLVKSIHQGVNESFSQLSEEEQKILAKSLVTNEKHPDLNDMLLTYKIPTTEENFADIQTGNITIHNAVYFINQCTRSLEEENYDKAIKVCSLYLDKFPEHPDVRGARAAAYFRKDMINDALEDAIKMKEIHPKRSEGYWISGICFEIMGNFDEALQNYKLSLEFEKDQEILCRINHSAGEIYEQFGDMESAKKHFDAEENIINNLKND